MEVESHSKIS